MRENMKEFEFYTETSWKMRARGAMQPCRRARAIVSDLPAQNSLSKQTASYGIFAASFWCQATKQRTEGCSDKGLCGT